MTVKTIQDLFVDELRDIYPCREAARKGASEDGQGRDQS